MLVQVSKNSNLPAAIFVNKVQWGFAVKIPGKGYEIYEGKSRFGTFSKETSKLVLFVEKYREINTSVANILD